MASRWVCGDFCWTDQAGSRAQARLFPLGRAIVQGIAVSPFPDQLPLVGCRLWTWRPRFDGFGRIDESQTVGDPRDRCDQPWRYQYWIFPGTKVLRKAGASWTCSGSGGKRGRRTKSSAPMRRRAFGPHSMSCDSADGPRRPWRVNMSTTRRRLQYLPLGRSPGRVLVDGRTKTGIDSFGRIGEQVMRSEPYRSASRSSGCCGHDPRPWVQAGYGDCGRLTEGGLGSYYRSHCKFWLISGPDRLR